LLGAVANIKRDYERLVPYVDSSAHMVLRILQTVTTAKVTYLLRTHPPELMRPAAEQFDADMREAFGLLLGEYFALGDFNSVAFDDAWGKATLPIRHGGLGLIPAVARCEAAYVSSFHAAGKNGAGTLVPALAPIFADLGAHLGLAPDEGDDNGGAGVVGGGGNDGGGGGVEPAAPAVAPPAGGLAPAAAVGGEPAAPPAHGGVPPVPEGGGEGEGVGEGAGVPPAPPEPPLPSVVAVHRAYEAVFGRLPVDERARFPRFGDLERLGVKGAQKMMTHLTEKERFRTLFAARGREDKALWRSMMGTNGGAAFALVPDPYGRAKFDNSSLGIRIRTQLLIPLRGAAGLPAVCRCGLPIDSRGYHILKCALTRGRVARHNKVLHTLAAIGRAGALGGTIEPPPGNFPDDRHTDLAFENTGGAGDMKLLIDVTVVHAWSQGVSVASERTRVQVSQIDGFAAMKAARRKVRKYTPHLPGNTVFAPFAVETFGRIGKEARRCMAMMAAETQRRRGWPSWYWWYIYAHRVSASIAQGNAEMYHAWMAAYADDAALHRGDDGDDEPGLLGCGEGRHLRAPARRRRREAMNGAVIAFEQREALEEGDDDDLAIMEMEGLVGVDWGGGPGHA
jgi:hypothetical protein